MKFTKYFLYMRQRSDRAKIKMEWIEETVKNPDYTEVQQDGRIRKWKKIRREGKFLRVILLPDGGPSIMLFLIEDSRRKLNEDKIFFRY